MSYVRVYKDGLQFKPSTFEILSFLVLSFFLPAAALVSAVLVPAAYAQETATITIESVSNSSATRGKKIVVTHYLDEQCGRRGKTDKVFKKNFADDLHSFNPLAVETDSPFIFQVSYTEKRRTETRSCATIANVKLEANRSYKAVFNIVEEVLGCTIDVYDITDQAANSSPESVQTLVEHSKPEFTCHRVGKPGYKSGAPVYSYKDRLG
jgi:hypothetical protein